MDPALRKLVRERAGNRCEYCHVAQQHQPYAPFHIDHIRAKKHRGRLTAANLALACRHCNLHKGTDIAGIDAITHRGTRLFNPRRDDWDEHFRWEGPVLVAATAVGRATIELLAINSLERVELREELMSEGLFP